MDTTVKGGSFLYRAVVADLVLYGLGHHFPRIIDRADKMGAEEQLEARRAFFTRNLNHTLASTIAHRAAAGHHPSTVTLLGATTPVSGCSRFTRPISLTESLASGAEELPTNQYSQRWQMMPRFNQVATAAPSRPRAPPLSAPCDLPHATITLRPNHVTLSSPLPTFLLPWCDLVSVLRACSASWPSVAHICRSSVGDAFASALAGALRCGGFEDFLTCA